jgi:predicted AAA+ superfamily ATPase
MYRIILEYFEMWRISPIRTPLLLRGARQVGKSHVIRQFGQQSFANLIEINLETQPQFLSCFESRDAKKICAQIEAISGTSISLQNTLLFIDEIQSSKDALLSLRSFKESLPDLHVIAAGSLLEFALQEGDALSFPVGRVTFAYLQPLSFKEFLLAMGHQKICKIINEATLTDPCSAAVHHMLLDLVRTYFVVGGMPEAINAFCISQKHLEVRRIQNRLVTAFVADFAKYGRRYDHRKLQTLLSAVPRLVGKKFKFSHVGSDASARDFKQPLLDLERAGLVRLVRASSGNGVPLGGEEREGIFKTQYLDIGLMLNSLGLDLFSASADHAVFVNEGALAEQFVGQELIASLDAEQTPELFYWTREIKGSESEVDFLIANGSTVIPIEVKSGATGRLKSLRQFMIDKKSESGIRISQHPLSTIDGLLSVPFYMVSEIPRLLKQSK